MNAKLRFFSFAAAGLLAGSAAVAFAQAPAQGPGPGPQYGPCPMGQGVGYGPHHGMRGEGFDPARVDARLNAMATALQLQPNQQAAWEAYAGKVKNQAAVRAKMRADMIAVMNDRQKALELRAEHMKANGAALSDIAQARAALSAVLSPEQKTTLDNFGRGQMRGYGYGHGHGHGHGYGGGRGCGGPAV